MREDFFKVEQVVRRQGLDPNQELPVLRYGRRVSGLLVGALEEARQLGKVLVFHDGVPKTVLGDGASSQRSSDLESLFTDLVHRQFADCVSVRVISPACGFSSAEALASLTSSERVAQLVQEEGPAVVLVLGSGSLTDVVKHALYLAQMDSIALWLFPTALTVTAFTSRFAVLESSGIKVTHDSRRADRVFFAQDVLEGAPIALQRAGVGDLLAGLVSYADWRLAHLLGLSDFRAQAYDLMVEMNRCLLPEFFLMKGTGEEPEGELPSKRPAQPRFPVRTLAAALTAAGVAMNLGGSSAPQSGGEHAVSHVIDFLRSISHRRKWSHGLQVALASGCACAFYDHLRDAEFIPFNRVSIPEADELELLVQRVFTEAPFLGGSEHGYPEMREAFFSQHEREVREAQSYFIEVAERKRQCWLGIRAGFSEFQKRWEQEGSSLIASVPTQQRFGDLMHFWGLPQVPEDMDPAGTAQEFRWSVRFSPFFRPRFGVQDLLFFLGEDPVIVAAI